MDRPEDVEPNPVTGKVYAALTSNDRRTPAQASGANPRPNNKFGHVLEIVEEGGDHAGTRFRWDILLKAGDPANPDHKADYQGRRDVSPLSNPDNLGFDDAGRMWITTDGMSHTLGRTTGRGSWRPRARRAAWRSSSSPVRSAARFAGRSSPRTTGPSSSRFSIRDGTRRSDDRQAGQPLAGLRPDMPPRPSVVAIYRTDGGKVGT